MLIIAHYVHNHSKFIAFWYVKYLVPHQQTVFMKPFTAVITFNPSFFTFSIWKFQNCWARIYFNCTVPLRRRRSCYIKLFSIVFSTTWEWSPVIVADWKYSVPNWSPSSTTKWFDWNSSFFWFLLYSCTLTYHIKKLNT